MDEIETCGIKLPATADAAGAVDKQLATIVGADGTGYYQAAAVTGNREKNLWSPVRNSRWHSKMFVARKHIG